MFNCSIKANCLFVGPGLVGGMSSMGGLSKGSLPVFTRVSGKTKENSELHGEGIEKLYRSLTDEKQQTN